MAEFFLCILLLVISEVPISLSAKTKTEVSVVSLSSCRAEMNGTGEFINLEPLQRDDGYPRYTTKYTSIGEVWNYSFNPCTAFSEPLNNLHEVLGDGCLSVSVCKFSKQKKQFYYSLGLQSKAEFLVQTDEKNNTRLVLVFTGYKSMRRRKTFIELVCDRKRRTVDSGLFTIVDDHGRGPVKAQLRHLCCCLNGCSGPDAVDSTGQAKKGGVDGGMMMVLVGTILGLLFVVAVIGCLCYIKRTSLQIYHKLPGIHNIPPSSAGQLAPSMEKGLGNSGPSRTAAYRDYEPASELRKKRLPVLEDSIISIDCLEMGQRLGGGIFVDTHIAQWQNMTFALKRLTINVHGNQVTDDTTEFMKSEVWFLSRLRHKNIVTVLGLSLDGKHPCIITEYVSGECLKDLLKVRGKELTWPQVIKMCNHVADGMAFLHSTKPPVLHRDLRCGNLFLLEDDVIKVADFGLTKLLQPVRQECSQDDCCCQRNYSACPASFRWTAPEVLEYPTSMEDDAVITTAADVYSFGVVMWEIIMCEDPFDDVNTEPEILEIVKNGGRPRMPTSSDTMPQYKDLMKECWVKEPHDRPTFKQVALRLKEIAGQARSFQKVVNNRQRQQKGQNSNAKV